eukprot:763670-Hanusia_phi.AAC.8
MDIKPAATRMGAEDDRFMDITERSIRVGKLLERVHDVLDQDRANLNVSRELKAKLEMRRQISKRRSQNLLQVDKENELKVVTRQTKVQKSLFEMQRNGPKVTD